MKTWSNGENEVSKAKAFKEADEWT